MMYSVSISESLNDVFRKHLIRVDEQEDLCFALYNISEGKRRITGVIKAPVLPLEGDRQVHWNASFNSDYFDRIITEARKNKCGICFMHSHPYPGWQGMSEDDIETESNMASSVFAATGLPLLGMTIGSDGYWSARFWVQSDGNSFRKVWCDDVRVVGYFIKKHLKPNEKKFVFGDEFKRTIASWGQKRQIDLANYRVGIVGLGSVGSQVAESLIKTGFKHITLIDFDRIELKNLDRLHSVSVEDIGKLKTTFYTSYLRRVAPNKSGLKIQDVPYSIVEKEGMLNALDCDILFSCVDRPWPRNILDRIAYGNNIPVIDAGIDAEFDATQNNLGYARWKVHAVGPKRASMHSLGQYTMDLVNSEMNGDFEDPLYIKGMPKDHFINRGENVFVFSHGCAFMAMQQLMSMILCVKNRVLGPKEYDFVSGSIDDDFLFEEQYDLPTTPYLGEGDKSNKTLISKHELAETSRKGIGLKAHSIKTKLNHFVKVFNTFFS